MTLHFHYQIYSCRLFCNFQNTIITNITTIITTKYSFFCTDVIMYKTARNILVYFYYLKVCQKMKLQAELPHMKNTFSFKLAILLVMIWYCNFYFVSNNSCKRTLCTKKVFYVSRPMKPFAAWSTILIYIWSSGTSKKIQIWNFFHNRNCRTSMRGWYRIKE